MNFFSFFQNKEDKLRLLELEQKRVALIQKFRAAKTKQGKLVLMSQMLVVTKEISLLKN